MKITHVTQEEWKRDYLEKTDIKEMVFSLQASTVKDLEIIKKMLNALHSEIKELSERIEKYETYSKAETTNITENYQ